MELFERLVSRIINKYCSDEDIAQEELPQIKIVNSIWEEIETVRPDMAKRLDKNAISKIAGYMLFFDNATGIVLIDATSFFNSISKNFFWVEVLVHEITHFRDYKSNLGIYGHDTYDSMLSCRSFWYWTEFHARYKGNLYMLDFVNKLPDEERKNMKSIW